MTIATPPAQELYLQLSWVKDLLTSLMPIIPKGQKRLKQHEELAANALLDAYTACKLAAKPITTFMPTPYYCAQ